MRTAWSKKPSGPLSPAEMGRGIAAANRNARRLLSDALSLYENAMYPSGAALAAIAMEESTKWWSLLRVALVQEPRSIAAAWRDYRAHVPKLHRVVQFMRHDVDQEPDDFSTMELAQMMQDLKERWFYSDFIDGRHWSEPIEACPHSLCCDQVSVAITVVTKCHVTAQRLGSVLEKVLGPLSDSREEAAKKALIAWSQSVEALTMSADDELANLEFRRQALERLGRCAKPGDG